MLTARWAYHHTDPSGVGLKWSQYCSPPVTIWRLEVKNCGHNGGSHGWNSALGHRPRVRVLGRGSSSPVANFQAVNKWYYDTIRLVVHCRIILNIYKTLCVNFSTQLMEATTFCNQLSLIRLHVCMLKSSIFRSPQVPKFQGRKK